MCRVVGSWLWFVAIYLHIMSSAVHQLCCLWGLSAGQLFYRAEVGGMELGNSGGDGHVAHCRV